MSEAVVNVRFTIQAGEDLVLLRQLALVTRAVGTVRRHVENVSITWVNGHHVEEPEVLHLLTDDEVTA